VILLRVSLAMVVEGTTARSGGTMRRLSHLAAMIFFALVAAAACSGASPTGAAERQFCSGHVTGAPSGDQPGPHISWTASATTDSLEGVVARYRKAHGPPTKVTPGGGASWELPSESARDLLSVSSAAEPGPWTTCEVPAGTRTIVMTSSMVTAE
jgi:hypothetical protein